MTQREIIAEIRAKVARENAAGEKTKKTANHENRSNRTYRMIDENDGSLFGSRYLGREGEMAWMPR